MEQSISDIRDVLHKAEADLREVMAKAAKAGDYRAVDAARAAAVAVRNLQSKVGSVLRDEDSLDRGAAPVGTRARSRQSQRSRLSYPKFLVSNNTLLRIGWSKKKSGEYTQKAPEGIVNVTVSALESLAASGAGPSTGEEIIGVANESASANIPSYQIYLVIGWLRDAGCIERLGREGYRIPENISAKAQAAWNESRTAR